MGVPSFKSESTVSSVEKGVVHDDTHFSSCLPLRPLALIEWAWKGRRSRKQDSQKIDSQKIEELRKTIDKDRMDVQSCLDSWELYRATWRLRAEAWVKDEDISVERRISGGFDYDTAYRYQVTLESLISGKKVVVVDFRTSEGRTEAIQWYESRYLSCNTCGTEFISDYSKWEDAYQEYMTTQEKKRSRNKQNNLRKTLLKGVPQVYWELSTSVRLPN